MTKVDKNSERLRITAFNYLISSVFIYMILKFGSNEGEIDKNRIKKYMCLPYVQMPSV
jgi:hypothetical protein